MSRDEISHWCFSVAPSLILLSICSLKAILVIVLAYSFNSGDFGVFQCLNIVVTVILNMITENSPSEMLCVWVLSASRHSLGDNSNVLLNLPLINPVMVL